MVNYVNVRQLIFALLINMIIVTSLQAQTVNNNPNTSDSLKPPPQDVNPPLPPPYLPETPPSSLPSPEELLPAPTISPEHLLNREETIIVTEFIFTGNNIFTSEELKEKFTKDLTNQSLSLNRLLTIAADIARLYSQQGYSTSGAIISIPETTQQQGMGIVEVKVIEGHGTTIGVLRT